MTPAADTLLIAADFFGYAREIQAALERRGRSVLWYQDRPATDTKTKLLIRLSPKLMEGVTRRYVDGIVETIRSHPITRVLVIKGEAFSVEAIERLREACPNAEFTLYFWDSYRNMPRDSAAKVACFDRAFSFDPKDVETDHRLRYRPLFYLDRFRNLPELEQDIDVLFLGTVHTDRYRVLKRLGATLPADIRFVTALYYPSRGLFAVRRVIDPRLWGARPEEFRFTPMGPPEVTQLIARSRIAVDVERAVQQGYTMRTIEMLGASKKLITTNPRIVEADFFHEQNIAVLDRAHPQLDESFLRSAYMPLEPAVLERYSLDGWLREVLPDADVPKSSYIRELYEPSLRSAAS